MKPTKRLMRVLPATLLAAASVPWTGGAARGLGAPTSPMLLSFNEIGATMALVGIALMVAEAFLPSFGVVGVSGIAAFAVGLLMLFDTPIPSFGLPWPVVIAAAVVGLAALLFAAVLVWRAHLRTVVTGEPALIGSTGRVVSWHGAHGRVHVRGETWRARSDQPITAGNLVRVVTRDDLVIIVTPLPPSSP